MMCTRCRGLMVPDRFVDLRDDTGRLEFVGWHCINCGEVVDPVVLTHRINGPIEPYRSRTRSRRAWGERIGPVTT
jgi:hypothetical protein